MQKILIGLLAVAIVGTVGYGVVTSMQQPEQPDVTVEVTETVAESTEEVAATEQAAESTEEMAETEAVAEPTEEVAATEQAAESTEEVAATEQAAVFDMDMGELWEAYGTITGIETAGLMLMPMDAEEAVFVELGPPHFWQDQGVELVVGDEVMVTGFDNGEQIHAKTVTTETAQLQVRAENGQPLWSDGEGEAMVAMEDWITLEATVTRTTNGGLDITTADGEAMSLQLGRRDFWQEQDVTLNVGEAITVLGFWQEADFLAGEIQVVETGERIFLRDPNGRPLWGGPGNSGGGEGGGGNGNNGEGNSGNGNGNNGNGNGNNGNQGNGNGNNGNQGNQGNGNGNGNGNNGNQGNQGNGNGNKRNATPTAEGATS